MSPADSARTDDKRAPSCLSSLSALARAIIHHVVRILARCGATPHDIVSAVQHECAQIPRHWAAEARRAEAHRVPCEISDASHVLTVWFNEAAYLDAHGKPRLLPLEG